MYKNKVLESSCLYVPYSFVPPVLASSSRETLQTSEDECLLGYHAISYLTGALLLLS